MKSVPLWHPQYCNICHYMTPATCHVLSMGIHVPASRVYPGITGGYPKVSRCLLSNRVTDKLPNWVPGQHATRLRQPYTRKSQFGDESLQAIHCSGTDNQMKQENTQKT